MVVVTNSSRHTEPIPTTSDGLTSSFETCKVTLWHCRCESLLSCFVRVLFSSYSVGNSAATMSALHLSKADSRVLAQVFDPESGVSRPEILIDPSLPADKIISDAETIAFLRDRERDAIRHIENFEKATTSSDSDRTKAYHEALSTLNSVIKDYPHYASAFNNRAQVRRWYWGDRNMLCQPTSCMRPERTKAAQAAVGDLRQSIALASPERQADAVSPVQGRLLAQAYTQLGAVFHAAAKDLHTAAQDSMNEMEVVEDSLVDWTDDRFDEEASRCFYLGGLYGNEVAKALAVHTNPQAKLCGNIVKEAMRKELALAS